MKRSILTLAAAALAVVATAQTLEDCQQAAERNYPLIRQYDLIGKTTELTVANLQKGWLPQLSAQAQATYQSDVTAWPDNMKAMMQQMGLEMKGLGKAQYRVAVDLSQTIYDGGAIGSQKRVAREQGKVQEAQTEVTLYQVRKRVNEMYFAALLLDDQILLNRDLQHLLGTSEQKLASMVRGGTAAESDLLNVQAERLNAVQQATTLESQRRVLLAMLSTFCGMEVKEVTKSFALGGEDTRGEGQGFEVATLSGGKVAALSGFEVSSDKVTSPQNLKTSEPQNLNHRPELRLYDAQLRLADAQERALDAALMPRLGVFAQGYYGYPGYNMFEDMMRRSGSFNGMVGVRLTWNIGALYTRRGDKAKLQLQRELTETSRDVFLFNNQLEQMQQQEVIDRYRRLMADDEEIIRLRSAVRKAAESKLAHGIIDVHDLVREINQENAARLQRSMHEIEMLKSIYDHKYTTNGSEK